jgi:GT2 family glycosyltransferase
MKPEVSVIIVSYNVKQLLFTCLDTLYKFNSILNFEVIVIDNESKDGSVQMVKESFPNVHLIENNFNAGFSGANNQGMRIAKGEFIFLLNPDTEFLDDSLVKLVTFTKSQPEISLVAPKLLNSDHSLQISVWLSQIISPENFIISDLEKDCKNKRIEAASQLEEKLQFLKKCLLQISSLLIGNLTPFTSLTKSSVGRRIAVSHSSAARSMYSPWT